VSGPSSPAGDGPPVAVSSFAPFTARRYPARKPLSSATTYPDGEMRRLVLVRHGQTEWSVSGQHTGRTDIPLTDEGRREARRLAARLAGREFALVRVSPRSRARETAELAGLGQRAQVDEDLAEFDYGEYEGLTTPQIRERRPGWSIWDAGAPGGEVPAQVGVRADRVIARALTADGDVAVFGHGHLLRVLGARWVEQPAEFGGSLALSTAAICELGFERERRVVWLWNETAA
jgi:probable phosphoglycerate mutase